MLHIYESHGCIFILFFSFSCLFFLTILAPSVVFHRPQSHNLNKSRKSRVFSVCSFYSYKTELTRISCLTKHRWRHDNDFICSSHDCLWFLHFASLKSVTQRLNKFLSFCFIFFGNAIWPHVQTHGCTAFGIWFKTSKVNFQLPRLLICSLFHKVMQGSFCHKITLVNWDYYSALIVPISQFYCTNHFCVGRDALCHDLGLIWLMTKRNK